MPAKKTNKIDKATKKEPVEKRTQEVKVIVEKMLSLMGVTATVIVSENKENDAIVVDIDAKEEAGLLIGSKGETLEALQMIVGMIFRRKFTGWQRILINVSDWRERQEERLKEIAAQAAEKVRQSGEPQFLYNLSSSHRRLIHIALAEDKDIETESQGDGAERYLIVRPKKTVS